MSEFHTLTTIVLALLVIGSAQSVILSAIMWIKKEKLLSIWMAIFSIEVTHKVLIFTGFDPTYLQWLGFWFSFDLLYGPLLYLWVLKLLTHQTISKWQWLHFLPVLILLGFKIPAILALDPITRLDSVSLFINGDWGVKPTTAIDFLSNYLLYHPLIYSLLSLYRLLRYRFWFNTQQSEALEVRFDWVLNMVCLQIVMWVMVLVGISALPFPWVINWLISYLPAIIWINVLAMMSMMYHHLVVKAPSIPAQDLAPNLLEPEINKPIKEKYANNKLDDGAIKQIISSLEKHMQAGLFKQPKLTLDQVAIELDLPAHWISQVLNDQLQCNFFDYINRQRIETIQQALSDPNNQDNILDIAFANGFNSKSTFNTVFKKQTQMTPRQYRNTPKAS
jgi:AraC-like DNA-binding protein